MNGVVNVSAVSTIIRQRVAVFDAGMIHVVTLYTEMHGLGLGYYMPIFLFIYFNFYWASRHLYNYVFVLINPHNQWLL